MTTLDDLLRAVCADPADDGARLAYADWLEEEGQTERAEFIRVQCELARIDREEDAWHRPYVVNGERVTPEPWGALRRRERELLKARHSGQENEDRWSHGFNFVGWSHQFRRGFIEFVTCSCADWLAHGPAIVAAQPVTAVRLADREPVEIVGGGCLSWATATGDRLGDRDGTAELPQLLFDLIAGVTGRHIYSWHPTREAAHAALSAACVRWARAAAGLPPLEKTP